MCLGLPEGHFPEEAARGGPRPGSWRVRSSDLFQTPAHVACCCPQPAAQVSMPKVSGATSGAVAGGLGPPMKVNAVGPFQVSPEDSASEKPPRGSDGMI